MNIFQSCEVFWIANNIWTHHIKDSFHILLICSTEAQKLCLFQGIVTDSSKERSYNHNDTRKLDQNIS